MGFTTTIMNPVTIPQQQNAPFGADFSDDEIEKTIAEIQQALRKTNRTQ